MEMQAAKKNFRTDTVIVLAIVTFMNLCVLYIPLYIKQFDIDIARYTLVQITSVILLCANIAIYTHVNSFMSRNWLDEKKEKQMKNVRKYTIITLIIINAGIL